MKLVYKFVLCLLPGYFGYGQPATLGQPVENPSKILKDALSLVYYQRDYLRLSQDFKAFSPNSRSITKEVFFKMFSTGNYLPLRLQSKDGVNVYKLYKTGTSANADTHGILKGWGELGYNHYKMEGQRLPQFSFTDLNGKVYKPETTIGKILVIKCWYLACQACREEIPDLNQLVARYKERKDVIFVALTFDPKKDIEQFLSKTKFNYAIVPGEKHYIMHDINIAMFPTHLVVDKDGRIMKVVNSADELAVALYKATSK